MQTSATVLGRHHLGGGGDGGGGGGSGGGGDGGGGLQNRTSQSIKTAWLDYGIVSRDSGFQRMVRIKWLVQ